MPLLELEYTPEISLLGLWQIAETEQWFLQALGLSLTEWSEYQSIHAEKRRLEWLASRHLVKLLAWEEGVDFQFQKDGFGKPWLLNAGKHISISHSAGICAAMLAAVPCGTDIQRLESRMEALAPRFMGKPELDSLSAAHLLEHIHIFWGAKEALFKAYGRKSLDFRTQICINPFPFAPEGGACTGSVLKDDFAANYHIRYRIREGYVWVIAEQTALISEDF
jgi:4'-phosphopantetheinyl transferase